MKVMSVIVQPNIFSFAKCTYVNAVTVSFMIFIAFHDDQYTCILKQILKQNLIYYKRYKKRLIKHNECDHDWYC